MRQILLLGILIFSFQKISAQVNEKKIGSWYVYAFNADLNNSLWGFQGDVQHRNWNVSSDLEQLLLRGGVHYTPKNTRFKLTLGYAYILSSAYDSRSYSNHENRIYQEVRFPHIVGKRFHFSHRLRFEQRFVQRQNFRTRIRYAFGIDISLNSTLIIKKTWFVSLYDEVFINGQKAISDTVQVDYFDRNRAYVGLGYVISDHLKGVLGFMHQNTERYAKNQLQVSLLHSF
ncbi:DUF2490 domain-containing protein [Formosa haliotis]|uniref:DUF2490 domain-containing protein n=1 Tax=Formosa haliotis TaxID=1555194 RepID=UPI000826E1A0|nr:DUF2490 domain-containing protein [Formosa haliotis]